MTTETETVESIRELIEAAIVDHCKGSDLYMASKMAAEKIAAAHTREVALLKQANIAYSSDNANLLGRAMSAEAKLRELLKRIRPDVEVAPWVYKELSALIEEKH